MISDGYHSKIVYYARAVGWPILLPWSVYYFASHRGRKCHISVSKPGGNEALSRLRLGWQFTRAVDCPSFFLPRCVIYYFLIVYYVPRPGSRILHSRVDCCKHANMISYFPAEVRILFFFIPWLCE